MEETSKHRDKKLDRQETTEYIDNEKKILKIINDRYKLKEELGKGAHGRIYSGRDLHTKQHVAIKVVIYFCQCN